MATIDNGQSVISLSEAVEVIKTAILQGQYEALKDVNRVQLAVYFAIGKYLSVNTRKLAYGAGAIKAISEQLHKELPGLRGFAESSLKNMRRFFEEWKTLDGTANIEQQSPITIGESADSNSPIAIGESQSTVNKIDIHHSIMVPNIAKFPIDDFLKVPFTHHIRLIERTQDIKARYYYIHRIVEEHLSVDTLEKLISQQAYENCATIPNNFSSTISNSQIARKAVMMFKDSYALEFINTEEIGERDKQDIDEKVLEQKIIQNIKNFIMTFGSDFAFVGNQYHLEIYGEEFFPDLIFFNRELNALVVVELKIGDFKPSYLGQLTAYLKILDTKVRKSHENPSIGIVLCKSANKDFVEFVIQEYDRPMGVATYSTADKMPDHLRKALPDVEELKKIMNKE